MGKVLSFKREPQLTPEELEAYEIARQLRDLFTEEEMEQIKKELEADDTKDPRG